MFIYIVTQAFAGLAAGILIAACSNKLEGVEYGKLDKAGRITNIILVPVYGFLSLFCMGMGLFSYPGYDGFLRILGWIVAILIPSAPVVCFIGLGLSVALRKKGKSKLSFAVQFVGFGAIALSVLMFVLFYGNLLRYIN